MKLDLCVTGDENSFYTTYRVEGSVKLSLRSTFYVLRSTFPLHRLLTLAKSRDQAAAAPDVAFHFAQGT